MLLSISNNPMVLAEGKDADCIEVNGTPLDVLYKALNLLMSGKYCLFGHPIAGNERLLKNPFRTVVFKSIDSIDESVLIQQCAYINRVLAKMEQIDYSAVPGNMSSDYKTVDYQLYRGIVSSL